MRKLYLCIIRTSVLLAAILTQTVVFAQCETGQVELMMTISVDAWGQETYWELVPAGNECGDGTIAFGSNVNVGCAATDPANGNDGYPDNTVVTEGPFCLESGVDYSLIFVDSYGDGGLTFELFENGSFAHVYVGTGEGNTWTFTAGNSGLPIYDSPCGGLEVMPDGTEVEISNVGAIFQPSEPTPNNGNCGLLGFWCEVNLTNTVWAYFIPEAETTYEITTCGSLQGFDTQLALYRADDCMDFSSFELIAASDDMAGGCATSNGFSSRMFASCLDPESVYYIQLDGWAGATGTASLSVTPYDGANNLGVQTRNIQCPLDKGEEGDGQLLPYLSGSGSNFTCSWTGPDGFTSTDNYLYGLSAGTYELTLISACGETFTNDYTVTQPAMWTVIADVTGPDCDLSANGSIELNVSGATAPYTYAWAGPNDFSSELFNPSQLDTGAYSVVITDDNDCLFTQGYDLISLNNFSFSLGNDTVLCIYDDLVVSGPAGYDYLWQDGSVNQFFQIIGDEWGLGTHAVLLTATTDVGCSYTDAFQFTVDACTGVDGALDPHLAVFPNPTNGIITVHTKLPVSKGIMELIDATGRVVERITISGGEQFSWSIQQPAGIYTLRIYSDTGNYLGRVVKE
jgi:hypothetical protein